MTFLMLLSVGFYQGQKTRWVRKHKSSRRSLGLGVLEDQTQESGG